MTPDLRDLEARARWHLEIGYPPYPPIEEPEYDEDYDAEFWDGYGGQYTCWACGGEGFEITCCDDLCHGQGWCMHGDGERTCRECHGDGTL